MGTPGKPVCTALGELVPLLDAGPPVADDVRLYDVLGVVDGESSPVAVPADKLGSFLWLELLILNEGNDRICNVEVWGSFYA